VEEVIKVSEAPDQFNVSLVEEVLHFVIDEVLIQQIVSEDEMVYAKRVDCITDDLLYRAEATPGTLDSQPLWRIYRITIGVDGDVTTEWAGGGATFTSVWDDRLTLTYS
jgi:hypothetical protein